MMCQHCKKDFEESNIHLHHIHPRFMDNKRGDGMKINLCKKCHDKIHFTIPSLYWNLLTEEQKTIAKKRVISYGKKYGGLNDT